MSEWTIRGGHLERAIRGGQLEGGRKGARREERERQREKREEGGRRGERSRIIYIFKEIKMLSACLESSTNTCCMVPRSMV